MAAVKRSFQQREHDLVFIADLYLQGKSHQEIATLLNSQREYHLSRSMISKDIKRIYSRWQAQYLSDFNQLKVKELAKIDKLEAEYWRAWEKSKEERSASEVIEIEDSMPSGDDLKTSYQRTKTTTKKEKRDPNFLFLTGIQWCIDQRCKIFGLLAPKTVNLNWREQAEEAGVMEPDNLVDSLAQQFLNAAMKPKDPESGS